MNNKKKIIAICVCVALLAGTILSGTIAYFTDTKSISNEFTSGNVKIDLTENATFDENFENYKLFPGDSFEKRPIITVRADSDPAYVAAIVKVTAGDLTKMNDKTTDFVKDGKLDIVGLLSGGVLTDSNTTYATTIDEVKTAATEYVVYQAGTYDFYIFVNTAKTAGQSVELFNTLTVPTDWDHDEMDELKSLKIDVNAYAVQQQNITDCYTAMTSAFETAFTAVIPQP